MTVVHLIMVKEMCLMRREQSDLSRPPALQCLLTAAVPSTAVVAMSRDVFSAMNRELFCPAVTQEGA